MKSLKYLSIVGMMLIFSSQLFGQATERGIVPVQRGDQAAPQSFYVNVSVDHENRVYEEGDLMTITVNSSKAGYLYLLYRDANGDTCLLFPNRFHADNRISANQEIKIPSAQMTFDLNTEPPFGKETLQALVTLEPIDIEDESIMECRNGEDFKFLDKSQLKMLKEATVKAIRPRERVTQVTTTTQQEQPETTTTAPETTTTAPETTTTAPETTTTAPETTTTPEQPAAETPQQHDNDVAEFTMEILTCPKGQVPQTQKKRVFVGICVAKYLDNEIGSLPACEEDIKAMGLFFNKSSAVDTQESIMYVNEAATKEKIRDLFGNYLVKHTNPGDEVIIYWTGHGGHCSDTNGDEKDGFDETLILYDSKAYDPATQLIDDDFGTWVQNLSGRKVLFILDTCYSGGLGERTKSLTNAAKMRKLDWDFGFGECARMKDIGQKNLALIASSAQDETSLVKKDGDMSVMTWYMLEHLQNDAKINHKELYERIKPQVMNYVRRVYNAPQTVVFQNDFDSPMIINP